MVPAGGGPGAVSRYEQLLRATDGPATDLAVAMAEAGAACRATVGVRDGREAAIRDVAAGVAAPALVGFVLWVLHEAGLAGLRRLCFLSRDAQVFHRIACRLAPRLGSPVELRYVYGSRRTWNLAAADPSALDRQDWLFNSFMRSNAADVCARLGLPVGDFEPLLATVGASADPRVRADRTEQAAALRRFVGLPQVAHAVAPRIRRMRELVRAYAVQERMTDVGTGLVDAGWTGRMIGALTTTTRDLPQPAVFLWAHEPRASGWTDPARVKAYMYNTATGNGVDMRVPDTPYIVETFCMSDHGIVADYRPTPDGSVEAVTETSDNPAVTAWGFDVYRATIDRFCDALDLPPDAAASAAGLRPAVARVLHAFWITPTNAEAGAWGTYPYDSDPLARATRPLAAPFDPHHLRAVLTGAPLDQQDRAWLQGSLALSDQPAAEVADLLAPRYATIGAPATD